MQHIGPFNIHFYKKRMINSFIFATFAGNYKKIG